MWFCDRPTDQGFGSHTTPIIFWTLCHSRMIGVVWENGGSEKRVDFWKNDRRCMGNPPRAKNPNMIGVVWENPKKPLKTPKNGPKTGPEPKNGPKTAPEPKNRVFRPRRVQTPFWFAIPRRFVGRNPNFLKIKIYKIIEAIIFLKKMQTAVGGTSSANEPASEDSWPGPRPPFKDKNSGYKKS